MRYFRTVCSRSPALECSPLLPFWGTDPDRLLAGLVSYVTSLSQKISNELQRVFGCPIRMALYATDFAALGVE